MCDLVSSLVFYLKCKDNGTHIQLSTQCDSRNFDFYSQISHFLFRRSSALGPVPPWTLWNTSTPTRRPPSWRRPWPGHFFGCDLDLGLQTPRHRFTHRSDGPFSPPGFGICSHPFTTTFTRAKSTHFKCDFFLSRRDSAHNRVFFPSTKTQQAISYLEREP